MEITNFIKKYISGFGNKDIAYIRNILRNVSIVSNDKLYNIISYYILWHLLYINDDMSIYLSKDYIKELIKIIHDIDNSYQIEYKYSSKKLTLKSKFNKNIVNISTKYDENCNIVVSDVYKEGFELHGKLFIINSKLPESVLDTLDENRYINII